MNMNNNSIYIIFFQHTFFLCCILSRLLPTDALPPHAAILPGLHASHSIGRSTCRSARGGEGRGRGLRECEPGHVCHHRQVRVDKITHPHAHARLHARTHVRTHTRTHKLPAMCGIILLWTQTHPHACTESIEAMNQSVFIGCSE